MYLAKQLTPRSLPEIGRKIEELLLDLVELRSGDPVLGLGRRLSDQPPRSAAPI